MQRWLKIDISVGMQSTSDHIVRQTTELYFTFISLYKVGLYTVGNSIR